MKKIEMRKTTIIYCDECGTELTGNFRSVDYEGKERMDFCDNRTAKIKKTCFDKHRKTKS